MVGFELVVVEIGPDNFIGLTRKTPPETQTCQKLGTLSVSKNFTLVQ